MATRRTSAAAWDTLLRPLADGTGPRHLRLARALTELIESGSLPDGMALPSTRELAQRTGAGRNTVLAALACLVEQGYLVSRPRSGIRVAEGRIRPPLPDCGDPSPGPDWTGRFASDALAFETAAPEIPPGPLYSFRYGQFDLSLFPTGSWRECERAALGVLEIADWGRDMVDGDDAELIEQLRRHVLPHHGIWARPEEIIITLGGQQGRYLVARLLARPGSRVGLEHPGMPDMERVIRLIGAETVPLAVDADGAAPSAAMERCDTVVLTPGHQCPTTAVMPLARRREILDRAERGNFVVVEDTYEMELLRDAGRIPALKSLDTAGRVIYIGSLSKQMAPGLRVGFVVAPPAVIRQLRALRRLIHRHPPGNNQRALAIFIERGYYRALLRRVGDELDRRALVLEQACRRWLPAASWQHQPGAAGFWFALPPGADGQRIAEAARAQGVLVEPGAPFFHGRSPRPNHLRIAVSSIAQDRIEDGIRRLAEVCATLAPLG